VTRIDPAAYVTLGGIKLSSTASAGVPVVLAGVHASWGRSDVLQNPSPGTGEFTVYDPTGIWGTGVDSKDATDWLNDTCDFGWTWAGVDRVFFRGTVTGIDVRPYGAGALLTFAVTSRLAQLGNMRNTVLLPSGVSATQRAAQLQSILGPTGAGGIATVAVTPTGGEPVLRDTPVRDRTMLQNLVDIYDASALTMSYRPNDRAVYSIARRVFTGVRGLAGLVKDTTGDRTGKGAYIAANAAAGQTARLFLDGTETQPSGSAWLTRTAEQRPSQVEVNLWRGATDAGGNTTSPTTDVAIYRPSWRISKTNEQVVSMDTRILTATGASTTGFALTVATRLGQALTQEGTAWRPEPVTFTFSIGGGAETLDQAVVLLAGGEYPDLFFVQRSAYPQLGIRPVFGVMGGDIARDDTGWLLTLNLAPVHTDTKQHPITWAEIDDGTTGNTIKHYLDGADHADGLHESVTVADLGYCSTGLGVTTPGPDTGWDTLQ